MKNKAIIFDTETHAKKSPRIVEAAYGYLDLVDGHLIRESIACSRFNPGMPMEYGAIAVHHILDSDVEHCPDYTTFELPQDALYIVGHNIGFDLGAIGSPAGLKSIDTLSLARVAWPGVSHTQTALYYMLHHQKGLSMELARDVVRSAHSARVDIQICDFILNALIEWSRPMLASLDLVLPTEVVNGSPESPLFEGLHYLSRAAEIPLVMPFGKHEGVPMEKVPLSYVNWYKSVEDQDPRVLMGMTQGGDTKEGQQLYKIAANLFGRKD